MSDDRAERDEGTIDVLALLVAGLAAHGVVPRNFLIRELTQHIARSSGGLSVVATQPVEQHFGYREGLGYRVGRHPADPAPATARLEPARQLLAALHRQLPSAAAAAAPAEPA